MTMTRDAGWTTGVSARFFPLGRSGRSRSGSVMLIVLGLMGILIGLLLAVSMQVRSAIAGVPAYQHSVETYVMLQTAKLLIQGRQSDGTLATAPAVTAGDQVGLPGRPFAASLGWVHVKADPANPTSSFDVVAAGGSAGAGGLKSGIGTISAGDPVSNAFEVRFHYHLSYAATAAAPIPPFTIQVDDVVDNTQYPW